MKSTYNLMSMLSALAAVAYLTIGCGSTPAGPHVGHNHGTEVADDAHAGHDHTVGDSHEGEAACDGHDHAATPTAPPEAKSTDDHDHAAEGAITLPAEQAAELGLTYEKATAAPFSSVIRTSGAIEGAEGDRATVVATTSGIVRLGAAAVKGGLTVGAKVAQGAALLSINSATLTSANLPQEIADARARLTKAEADLKRIQSLSGDRISTAAELETARLEVETQTSRLKTLTGSTTDGAKSITAPRGGYITSLVVTEGDYVTEGQVLATISSNRTLRLRADLPLRYAAQAAAIRGANFTALYDSHNYALADLGGRLVGRAQSLEAGSATIPVRFEFNNSIELLNGSAVEVFLLGAERSGVITVPLTAITEQQGAHFIYLKTCVDSYAKRAVTLGESNGSRIEITGGLVTGEEYVATGAYFVRLASLSGAIPDGHNH